MNTENLSHDLCVYLFV